MRTALPILFFFSLILTGCRKELAHTITSVPTINKKLTINAAQRFQTIDGFGVNITPAQWRNENLKPTIDSLVDDLGSTLIRFDCYGRADWLDPKMQQPDGSFPEQYLEKVYTSPVFKDAWATFRYFNAKGIEPIFNISGAIDAGWATDHNGKQQRLKNFDAYAEMAVTLLKWAREKEGLKFSLFMPFNETDLGFPEGPRFLDEDCYPAFVAMMEKLKKNGFENLPVVVMDDSSLNPKRLEDILKNEQYAPRVKGFGWHTYGNGGDADSQNGWVDQKSNFNIFMESTKATAYANKSFWLTEYGDLDQSNEIEFEFAWRSARRLLKSLNDGITGAMAWDAFDNYHVHDSTWARYGLFQTDTIHWTYKSKPRYYAAKHFYKFIRPGFVRVSIDQKKVDHVYANWTDSLKNIYRTAFVSPAADDFTFVGMSMVETNVSLTIHLAGFPNTINGKKVAYYFTNRDSNCVKKGEALIENNKVTVVIPERSIVTVTTVGKN